MLNTTMSSDVLNDTEAVNKPKRNKKQRYHLELPSDVYDELKRVAEHKDMTVASLIRQFIKLGLIVSQVDESTDRTILIQDGDRTRELVLF